MGTGAERVQVEAGAALGWTRWRRTQQAACDAGSAAVVVEDRVLVGENCTRDIVRPRYRAPEVLSNSQIAAFTEKSDIYSASMAIYFLLTGRRPENDVKIDPRWRPTTMVSRLRWRKVSDLLERMWAYDAEQRPSAGECAECFSKLGEADEDAEKSLQRAAVLPSTSVYDDSSHASELVGIVAA